jgi:hypothetical protein
MLAAVVVAIVLPSHTSGSSGELPVVQDWTLVKAVIAVGGILIGLVVVSIARRSSS